MTRVVNNPTETARIDAIWRGGPHGERIVLPPKTSAAFEDDAADWLLNTYQFLKEITGGVASKIIAKHLRESTQTEAPVKQEDTHAPLVSIKNPDTEPIPVAHGVEVYGPGMEDE